MEQAFLSALPTEPLYCFSHTVVPTKQQKATCVYRALAWHSRNLLSKYSAVPNASNVMWAGQTLLCLTVPPSGKMETICTSLPLNLYKPTNFSNGVGLQLHRSAATKEASALSSLSVPSHTTERANKKTPHQVLHPLPPASRVVRKPIHTGHVWSVQHAAPAPSGLSSHQLLCGAVDGGAGALRDTGNSGVPPVLQHLTQLQLPTAERGKKKLSCNLWQQSFCWI